MFNAKRANFIKIIIFSIFVIAFIRLFYIQIVEGLFYKKKNDWNVITLKVPAKRGNIFDRNGVLLATDVESYVMYVDKKIIKNRERIGRILETKGIISRNEFIERLNETSSRVVIVKKGLTKEDVKNAGDIEGIFFTMEWKRFYPHGNILRTVLGKINYERKGIAGIEKQFDKFLSGKDGFETYVLNLRSKYRYINYPDGKNIEPINGKDMYLTIDFNIQDICDKVARKTREKTGASNVLCVVIDPETGEILGLADVPELDETDKWKMSSFVERDYEPGSIFKLIPAACWLLEKKDTSKIVCEKNEKKKFNNKVLKDENDHPAYNFVQSFANSSNVGFINIGFEIGAKKILEISKRFGLFSKTGIELPNEVTGKPFSENYKYKIDFANVCFGQGFKTTIAQIVYAYAAIGNNGIRLKPQIVKKITDGKLNYYEGKKEKVCKVLNKKMNEKVINIMEKVVEYGTGRLANIPGVKIIGKTGTGEQGKSTGYSGENYLSSFIGIINPENNGLLIGVFIENPVGSHKASVIACPAFKEIAERIITLKDYRERFLRSIAYENERDSK
uniref:Penicillin-binding protein 2 n=1 Tax=candidate division WOR-3 bacterium TaxID=2052148 RepID=A0A7C4UF72_UNCW3